MAEIKKIGMFEDNFMRMLNAVSEQDNTLVQIPNESDYKQHKFEMYSHVGKKYLKKTLSDYVASTDEQIKALDTVKNYISEILNNKNKTMWMCGTSGTGKTFLAAMIVRECGGYFVKSYQIADEIDDTKRFSSSESKSMLIKRYSEYDLLVIDEIGKFDSTKGEIEYLFRILNERYENELPTILISNKTKNELKDYIGKPLYDRFVETCTAIEFKGESYRKNERVS